MAPKKVVVIGAGPVGSLAALYFSHADWDVELYELRGGSVSYPWSVYSCRLID